YQMGYNEGFNTYWQQAVARGAHIYGKPPTVTYANYPPISFHLIGWLGRITGDQNIAGRWVSFLAYLAIACAIGGIVFRPPGTRPHGAYAGLAWLIWLAAFDPSRIGFNDPHMLGVALGLAGVYCYLLKPGSVVCLVLSGLAFALSLFTKQSLIALPAAVGLHLVLASRKRFAVWAGATVGFLLVLMVLTLQVDGPYFLQHLSIPRTYSMLNLAGSVTSYIAFFNAPFAAALILI